MFEKLMLGRGIRYYRRSYVNILCVFAAAMAMFSFMNVFAASLLNYTEAVELPYITRDWTCDFRIVNAVPGQEELFRGIPGVRAEFENGSICFYLTDPGNAAGPWEAVKEIWYEKFRNPYMAAVGVDDESFPALYSYVGRDGRDTIYDYEAHRNEIQTNVLLFQSVLSVLALSAMIAICGEYIAERTPDIRTLCGIGIGGGQLGRLFFFEAGLLYLASAAVGIPLGAGIAALFFSGARGIGPDRSPAEYPVFRMDAGSLGLTLLFGWLAVVLTYAVMMKKVLSIDASYTCMETVPNRRAERHRDLYRKKRTSGRFDRFFAEVLRKRGTSLLLARDVLESVSLAVGVFSLNAVNYLLDEDARMTGWNRDSVMISLANNSLFVMLGVFAVFFSLAAVWIFTKRHAESMAEAVGILGALGAEEGEIYACFRRLTVRSQAVSLAAGFALGYTVTLGVFEAAGYRIPVNLPYLLAHVPLAGVYCLAAWIGAKTAYGKICKNIEAGEDGEPIPAGEEE